MIQKSPSRLSSTEEKRQGDVVNVERWRFNRCRCRKILAPKTRLGKKTTDGLFHRDERIHRKILKGTGKNNKMLRHQKRYRWLVEFRGIPRMDQNQNLLKRLCHPPQGFSPLLVSSQLLKLFAKTSTHILFVPYHGLVGKNS